MIDERVNDVLTNIKRKRKILGYSLDEFAELVHMSSSAYQKIEAGKSPLTLEHFFRFVEALNISAEKLLKPPL